MSAHLGYDKHDPVGRDRGNSRNGVRSKTVLTEVGPVEIEVPRDTDASFQPQIVGAELAFDQGNDRGLLGGSDDQVPLPVAGLFA